MKSARVFLFFALFLGAAYASDLDDDFGQKARISGVVPRGPWAGFLRNMVMGDPVLKTTELDGVVCEPLAKVNTK